jgi:hypothetical protein
MAVLNPMSPICIKIILSGKDSNAEFSVLKAKKDITCEATILPKSNSERFPIAKHYHPIKNLLKSPISKNKQIMVIESFLGIRELDGRLSDVCLV